MKDMSLEELKMENKILNQQMDSVYKRMKDLICCGNCGKHYKDCHNELSYEFCDKWQSDGLSREEREK